MRYLPERTDISQFDEWFDATFAPLGDEVPPERIDALRNWARHLFATSGPIGRDVVAAAFQAEQLHAIETAVALVLADLSVASSRVPSIEIDSHQQGVRIAVDGDFTEPSISALRPFDVSETAVEIVEYIREQVSQDDSVSFPVCSRHENSYLLAVIDNGIAVWRCNRGAHVVAVIGQLRESS